MARSKECSGCCFPPTDLSVQAAQLVLNADSTDALQVLTNVSQNFPTMASTLTRMTVSPDIMNEIRKNQEVCIEQCFSVIVF